MTPAYLNPPSSPYPLVEQRDQDQHLKLFISPYGASSSLSSYPTFFDTTQDERGSMLEESQDHHYEKVHRPISHGSCDHQAFSFSSSEAMEEDFNNPHKSAISERGEGDGSKTATGPVQWMSSKMRLMQKMMEPNCSAANKPVRIVKKFQNNPQHGDLETTSPKISNNTIRVCAEIGYCVRRCGVKPCGAPVRISPVRIQWSPACHLINEGKPRFLLRTEFVMVRPERFQTLLRI